MHNASSAVARDASSPGNDAAALPTRTLLEAIARRLCVTAVYNRMAVTLAPHIVYTRHDELFVDAITVEREGKPPREIKLGTFKLAGLGNTTLTTRAFEPHREFDAKLEKYSGVTIFTV